MNARLFYLTLPSGRTLPVSAFTLHELIDIVQAHAVNLDGGQIWMVWNSIRMSHPYRNLTEAPA